MSATAVKQGTFDTWRAMCWSEDALIPASQALICWAYDPGRDLMTDVLVTEFPNDREYFADHWFGTGGACHTDWLEPGKHTMTPESVFGEMAGAYGFASKAVAEKAIVMFARIKECEWARKMLASDSYDKISKAGLTGHW
jgi:hypothetical protein